ncbi:hypothetical protein GX51_00405 [Blastomyces parvus]|uniref:Uncharacterized protein n=1 Tax=Blastomyces parvus TaxID=2060905 RepID=A0A2B7XL97_9EURO|nr:hypothetical protein GX51_00405 [Blastomyces parvus]
MSAVRPPPPPRGPPQQLFTFPQANPTLDDTLTRSLSGRHFLYAMVASVGAGLFTMSLYRLRQQKLAEAKRRYDEQQR